MMTACVWFMLLWILNGAILTQCGEDGQQKCSAIITPNFDSCKKLHPPSHADESYCSNAQVCHKQLHFTRLDVAPFTYITQIIVDHVMEVCCGPCRNISRYNTIQNTKIQQLNRSILNTSNIVFPVLGVGSATRIYGYHYIPLIKLPAGYYVTKAQTPEEIMARLITACGDLWPLLVIILLLSFISGFIVWSTDTWTNQEDFPRKFFVGILEGSWWAFVSMTTVGYGDKTPKSIVARLFSVFWILIGITICSMFTASLTNEISHANSPDNPDMHGRNVGILKYRTFDAASVAQHGGIIRETKGLSEEKDIVELQNMLTNADSTVNGLFLDKYTYMHVVNHAITIVDKKDPDSHAAKFFLEKTDSTKQDYDGEEMSYGLLIREEEDYEFLHEFIEDNHAVYESCITVGLNALNMVDDEGDESRNLFSPDGGSFYPTLAVALTVSGAILIFGVFFEMCRGRHRRLTAPAPAATT